MPKDDQPWYAQRCHEWWRMEWYDTYDTSDFPRATQEQNEQVAETAVEVIGCANRLRCTEPLTRRPPLGSLGFDPVVS